MRRQHLLPLPVLAVVCACVSCALAASAPVRQELGRQVKLRILVDKVMQPTEGWVTKEWMVKAAAAADLEYASRTRARRRQLGKETGCGQSWRPLSVSLLAGA